MSRKAERERKAGERKKKNQKAVHRTCIIQSVFTYMLEPVSMKGRETDSRYVIEKGKKIVIINPFQWHATGCQDGNLPAWAPASVWQNLCPCAGLSSCILVPSHSCCFRNSKYWPWHPHSTFITCCCSFSCVVTTQRLLPGYMPDMLYAGRLGCPFTPTW